MRKIVAGLFISLDGVTIVVGSGKRLFEESIGQVPLKLVDSKITSNGIALLHYQPAPG